ncbi:MAG: FAD-dependent thymidylate synthase [Eubacteriales bacterium]|nr:FAD-dependent thymidylate synthase [Eubacteriales bacterium]
MVQSSVKILFYNENADSIVASAGRISTTKGSANEIYKKSLERNEIENINLIQKILASGHTSVLEHVFLNLAFDNVSVFVEQFMIEFRLASFTVKSRRYVDFGNMGFVMPEFSKYGERADGMKEIYQRHMKYLFQEYNDLLDKGIPKEDARFVLPYSFRSNFYCTVNARELIKIVNEMVWGRGKEYPEIVSLGKSLIEQCKKKIPFLNLHEGHNPKKIYDISLMERKKAVDLKENEGEPVVLLNATEHPEETICKAVMLTEGYADWQSAEVKDSDTQKAILKSVLLNSRKRELEQVNFTILFQHISLAGVTHLVRHRMQSIIVPKYYNICEFDKYIVPESIVNAGMKEKYERVFRESHKVAEQLREEGLECSDQIYLLLSGLTVPVMTTMNANELFTFLRLRSCNRAQWEIAHYAKALLKILRKQYPVLFSLYGPTCYVTGKCPEGKMSCGQMKEVKASFAMDE